MAAVVGSLLFVVGWRLDTRARKTRLRRMRRRVGRRMASQRAANGPLGTGAGAADADHPSPGADDGGDASVRRERER